MWELETKRGTFTDVTTERLLSEIHHGTVSGSDRIRIEGGRWELVSSVPELAGAESRTKTNQAARLVVLLSVCALLVLCGLANL